MEFGTGLVCNSQIIVKAKIINSMRYFLPLCHCAAAHYPELAEG